MEKLPWANNLTAKKFHFKSIVLFELNNKCFDCFHVAVIIVIIFSADINHVMSAQHIVGSRNLVLGMN